ncbi:hypothetical protein HWV62_21416 [Athelia sp. TMB]|nr:hypothetical protein HWV62_21416 [Athelia sp. TMB]
MEATSTSGSPVNLDNILGHITASPAPQPSALAHTLRTCAPRDVRDNILCGTSNSGADPLVILDPRAHTLEYALQPLYDLITRFAPPNTLTALHTHFLRACVQTSHQSLALPILTTGPLSPPLPNTQGGKEILDTLHYTDHLAYHYSAGFALASLHQWALACEFLETVVTAPSGGGVSALQLEALKKLVIIQLIWKGAASPPMKYTAPLLTRLFQSSPYGSFAKAYPNSQAYLSSIIESEKTLFENDKNMGLMKMALARVPRWSVKALEGTYARIALSEAGAKVRLDEVGVVAVVLDLIEAGEINARIDPPGVLSFSSSPAGNRARTRGEVDRALREAEGHASTLKRLEMELARSRDYLSKAVKNREEPNWTSAVDDDMMFSPGERMGTGSFAEDVMFS